MGYQEVFSAHRDHFRDATPKEIYIELIQMMLEREFGRELSYRQLQDIKEVRKVIGYQDLTNNLLRRKAKELKDRVER